MQPVAEFKCNLFGSLLCAGSRGEKLKGEMGLWHGEFMGGTAKILRILATSASYYMGKIWDASDDWID